MSRNRKLTLHRDFRELYLRGASLLAGAAKVCYGYGSQSPGTLNGCAGAIIRGWAIWREDRGIWCESKERGEPNFKPHVRFASTKSRFIVPAPPSSGQVKNQQERRQDNEKTIPDSRHLGCSGAFRRPTCKGRPPHRRTSQLQVPLPGHQYGRLLHRTTNDLFVHIDR